MENKIKVQRGWHCTIIENQVINSDISCHAKMVYVVLCMYANRDDKTCYPSLKTICKDTSIKSKTTVKKGIDELIEKGFLEVISRKDDKGSNESNLYIIKDYPIPSNDIGQDMEQGGSADNIGVDQEMVHPIPPDGHELKPINKSQKNDTYTKEFLEWYELYPNPWNKSQSFKNFKSLMKNETFENLMLATKNYINYIKKKGTSKEFIVRSTNFIGQHQEYKGYLEMQEEKKEVEQRANCGAYKEWQGRKSING